MHTQLRLQHDTTAIMSVPYMKDIYWPYMYLSFIEFTLVMSTEAIFPISIRKCDIGMSESDDTDSH